MNPPDALPDAPHAHGACENCDTSLQGHYCHTCGQSAHNPLKHVGHAIEEVFESFWHLDGRIFRTLRDLLVPGRVALNYLRGKRVGYVQPLRLFVILTLFTFFVGKLTLHADDFGGHVKGTTLFDTAQTADEVEARRDAELTRLGQQFNDGATGGPALGIGIGAINAAAEQRLAELAKTAPQGAAGNAVQRATAVAGRTAQGRGGSFFNHQVGGKPWDPETNPIVIDSWPGFANKWLNHRLDNANANVARMGGKTDLYVQAVLTALPGALFFLMPVFALVLRVAYAGRRIGYLEHLVVALYSHAWLMLVLLATFLVAGLGNALAGPVVNATTDVVYVLLWLSVPVYLLWMQQRVYGGNVVLTLLRYLFIGGIYTVLVSLVVTYAVLAGISS